MALYLIGDIQGCNDALSRLLSKIDFSPSRDTLYVLGDMLNRGEDRGGVLQTLMGFGDSANVFSANCFVCEPEMATAAGAVPVGKDQVKEAKRSRW